jgi:hypothetical protein
MMLEVNDVRQAGKVNEILSVCFDQSRRLAGSKDTALPSLLNIKHQNKRACRPLVETLLALSAIWSKVPLLL